jgi:hypothetical protein
MLDILPPIVEGVAANILAYAVLLAAIATITMALLELVKAVTRARPIYHRKLVQAWVRDAYGELLVLTVAEVKSAAALFDQPTDKMMGQVQAAANVALDFPELYPKLYAFLTRIPQSPAAESAGVSPAGALKPDDANVWRDYSRTLDNDRKSDDELPPGAQAAMRARARLDHFVTRKLDAFQTRAEYLWGRANQLIAVIGCAAFTLILIFNSEAIDVSPVQGFFLATFGGMIAPFAKDVVTALSGLRAKAA